MNSPNLRGVGGTNVKGRHKGAVGLLVLMLAFQALPAASGKTNEIDKAKQQRLAVQRDLDKTVAAYEAAESKLAQTRQQLAASHLSLGEAEAHLQAAQQRIAARANVTYRQGSANLFSFLITAESFHDFIRRLTLVRKVAGQDAARMNIVEKARSQTAQIREELAKREQLQTDLLNQMAARTATLNSKFGEAQALEKKLAAEREAALRLEKRRKEKAAADAARSAAEAAKAKKVPEPKKPTPTAKPSLQATAVTKPAGSLRCPVDGPNSFTDTYGEPREGGRRHQGVDIFAAHGTPTVAVIEGVIDRKNSSSAGGISVLLKGTNGTDYFYTHLSGYADISVGQKVPAGAKVGYVGSTGNASTTAPHLHFEVHPDGGAAINPYPTAKAACG